MKLYNLLFFFFICARSFAETATPSYSDGCAFKVCIPGLEGELSFDLALPDNYRSLSIRSPSESVLWGEDKAIEQYNARLAIDSCLIAARVSESVKQKGVDTFETDPKTNRDFKCYGGG